MKILFLGDIVGDAGCAAVKKYLTKKIKELEIDFVIANGENAAKEGVGITESITNSLFDFGVDVVTTGNHVWDQKETLEHINREKKLLRPLNMQQSSPGRGFGVYISKKGFKVGVLNLIGNIFMPGKGKYEDVFETAQKFIDKNKLKIDFDFLLVDFHGEITSEKMAMGHFFDGKATCVVGTHTHVPTSDTIILKKGTAYQTDAGMCGDYNSVIGMNKENSLNKFLKKNSQKHYPADGEASLCGSIIECDDRTGLAKNIKQFVYGGVLDNSQ